MWRFRLSHVHVALQLLDAQLAILVGFGREEAHRQAVVAEDEGLSASRRLPIHVDDVQVKWGQRITLEHVLTVLVLHARDVVDGDLVW